MIMDPSAYLLHVNPILSQWYHIPCRAQNICLTLAHALILHTIVTNIKIDSHLQGVLAEVTKTHTA